MVLGWLGCLVAAIESYRFGGGPSSTIHEHLDPAIRCHFGKLSIRDLGNVALRGIGFDNQEAALIAASVKQLLKILVALKLIRFSVPATKQHLNWSNTSIWTR